MADRTFAAAVLTGLGGGALAAVAAAQDWASTTGDASGVPVRGTATGSESAPVVLALALVSLAAWGVVLVLRGRVRQAVAALGLLATVGALVALAQALDAAQDDSVRAATAAGATGDVFTTSLTGWYWATGVGLLLTAAAQAVAVRRARGWPAMGSRYDAPSGRAAATVTDQDLWRALDDGHDPTAEDDGSRP